MKKVKELKYKDQQDKMRVTFVANMEKQEKAKKKAMNGMIEKDSKKKEIVKEKIEGGTPSQRKEFKATETMPLNDVQGDKLLTKLYNQEKELNAKITYKSVWNQMQGKIATYSEKLSGLEQTMVGMPEVPVGYAEIKQTRDEREKDRIAKEQALSSDP